MSTSAVLADLPQNISKPSREQQAVYNKLVTQAKQLTDSGCIPEALTLFKQASGIYPAPSLNRKIERIEAYLAAKHTPAAEPALQSVNIRHASSAVPEHSQHAELALSSADKPCGSNAGLVPEHSQPAEPSLPSADEPYTSATGSMPQVQTALPQDLLQNTVKLSLEEQAVYNNLTTQAKRLIEAGRLPEALTLFRQASAMHPAPSLNRKIERIETYLAAQHTQAAEHALPTADDLHTSNRSSMTTQSQTAEPALQIFSECHTSATGPLLQSQTSRSPGKVSSTRDSSDCSQSHSRDGADDAYTEAVDGAKQAIERGQLTEALDLYRRAHTLRPSDRLARRVAKIENYLKQVESAHRDSDGDGSVEGNMVLLGDNFYLHEQLFAKLYSHQHKGVLWLWNLFKHRKGGILGDDMGLGKTIQVIAFLSGIFDAQQAKCVLIVMPVSLIVNWEKEFERWAPGISVLTFHGTSKRERERALSKIVRRGGVLLTSYGMVVSNCEMFAEHDGRELVWDCVILDEGHKIKNPTKTSKGVHGISARSRFILTGTPVQNNLKEMWALFDFTHHGMLLGTCRTFKMEYENPITRAREKCATHGERKLGQEMSESLKRIISPYFLRRTKSDIQDKCIEQGPEEKEHNGMPSLTRKNDLIIWLYLSEVQQNIYSDFLQLEDVKQLLMSSRSPLTALTVLKKICDHPRLLSTMACHRLGLDDDNGNLSEADENTLQEPAVNRIHSVDNDTLIAESGKMCFLVQLLDRLKTEGHRTLLFSLSRKMLDIIEKVMRSRGHKVMRLDGTVRDMQDRDQRVQTFQQDSSYDLFLLTTQVGGVGLTLTSAARVVIFDPSWNPATDAQAVDRAFRIGQQQNVVVYRFITCGTVEEKIYRRQIFKDSITKQTTGESKNPMRYFTKMELVELFQLDNPRSSATQQQLQQMHSRERKTDTSLDDHIAYLHSCDMFGLSDHDLMFTNEDHDQGEGSVLDDGGYVQQRVEKARQLIGMETEMQSRMNAQSGKYVPEFVRRPADARKTVGVKRHSGMNGDTSVGGCQEDEVESIAKNMGNITIDEEDGGNNPGCASDSKQRHITVGPSDDDEYDDDEYDDVDNKAAVQIIGSNAGVHCLTLPSLPTVHTAPSAQSGSDRLASNTTSVATTLPPSSPCYLSPRMPYAVQQEELIASPNCFERIISTVPITKRALATAVFGGSCEDSDSVVITLDSPAAADECAEAAGRIDESILIQDSFDGDPFYSCESTAVPCAPESFVMMHSDDDHDARQDALVVRKKSSRRSSCLPAYRPALSDGEEHSNVSVVPDSDDSRSASLMEVTPGRHVSPSRKRSRQSWHLPAIGDDDSDPVAGPGSEDVSESDARSFASGAEAGMAHDTDEECVGSIARQGRRVARVISSDDDEGNVSMHRADTAVASSAAKTSADIDLQSSCTTAVGKASMLRCSGGISGRRPSSQDTQEAVECSVNNNYYNNEVNGDEGDEGGSLDKRSVSELDDCDKEDNTYEDADGNVCEDAEGKEYNRDTDNGANVCNMYDRGEHDVGPVSGVEAVERELTGNEGVDIDGCEDGKVDDEEDNEGDEDSMEDESDEDYDGSSESSSGSMASEPDEHRVGKAACAEYIELQRQTRLYYEQGDYRRSLRCTLKALSIHPSERLQVLAVKLRNKLSQ